MCSQSQPQILLESWAEVQSEAGSGIQSVTTSGNVSTIILLRTEFLRSPLQSSSVLFPATRNNDLTTNAGKLADAQEFAHKTKNKTQRNALWNRHLKCRVQLIWFP